MNLSIETWWIRETKSQWSNQVNAVRCVEQKMEWIEKRIKKKHMKYTFKLITIKKDAKCTKKSLCNVPTTQKGDWRSTVNISLLPTGMWNALISIYWICSDVNDNQRYWPNPIPFSFSFYLSDSKKNHCDE